ncbi:MAG: hypothetical protein R3C30_16560 [Hyphomonadaceae bacterium]
MLTKYASAVLLAALFLCGCGEPLTPEEEAERIARIEARAEARDAREQAEREWPGHELLEPSGEGIQSGRGVSEEQMRSVLPEAVNLVRENGYRCETVSAFRPLTAFADGRGFSLYCDSYNSHYRIIDRGRGLTVERG